MSVQLLTILVGLVAAAAWGAGDFGGGVASRKFDALRVVIGAQLIGTIGLFGLAIVSGEALPDAQVIGIAVALGLVGGMGLLMLYDALAIGPMGVIAPLTAAICGIIPAAVGIALEGWPGTIRFAGFLLAIVAAWIIASPGDHSSPPKRALVLSVLAGLCFAIFLTAIAQISDTSTYWTLIFARVGSLSLFSAMLLMRRYRLRSLAESLRSPAKSPIPWFFIALAGVGDTMGNVFYVMATQIGRLDVAAVVSSLYPAATVLLARMFLDERLSKRQLAGVILALIAIVLIAL